MQRGRIRVRKRKEEEKLRTAIPVFVSQVSETEINGQFESVCESVFSEVESQAMEALDLPGSFRTRSHSYLRAIQAGYSQDDDCLPSMTSSTVTSTIRSTTGKTITPSKRERAQTTYLIRHMRTNFTYLHMYSGEPLSFRDAELIYPSYICWELWCVGAVCWDTKCLRVILHDSCIISSVSGCGVGVAML